ncbi:hypothetical protein CGMCC3_g1058 [Colletotrichum fructicola]|nr:uncharacterized protein CGMCC3_g1058 [Colletotrichum fructicola]KAE9582905.1 hypothetical protein CGMCC3_g1058 [Colletotrichum fructicola]
MRLHLLPVVEAFPFLRGHQPTVACPVRALCRVWAQMSLMEQELSKPGNQLPSGTWDYPYTLFESLELPSRLFTVQMPDTNQMPS